MYFNQQTLIKVQTLEAAEYKCEINPKHNTFIAKNTGKRYMEGHHVLPMYRQDKFDKCIDVYANLICLCPICHRLLHYGLDSEKKVLLNQIYESRIDRLVSRLVKRILLK